MHNFSTFARGASAGAVLRTIRVPDPDAGDPVIITPDAGRAWEVRSVFATLDTDDDEGNRTPELVYDTEVPFTWIIPAEDTIAPSASESFGWIADWSFSSPPGSSGPLLASMPHTILLPGYDLQIVVLGIVATDQLSHVTVQVVEISTGEREHDRSIANNLRARADAIGDLLTGDY